MVSSVRFPEFEQLTSNPAVRPCRSLRIDLGVQTIVIERGDAERIVTSLGARRQGKRSFSQVVEFRLRGSSSPEILTNVDDEERRPICFLLELLDVRCREPRRRVPVDPFCRFAWHIFSNRIDLGT